MSRRLAFKGGDYPEIAAMWNSALNGEGPENTTSGSSAKKFFTCDQGHDFDVAPKALTRRGQECPYCSGARVLAGYNDLTTTHPLLAAEYLSTNPIAVTAISAGSNKIVCWKGTECGHEWTAQVNSRRAGNGCPYCANRKTLPGFNSLADLFPDMLSSWDYEKNDVDPTEIAPGRNALAHWKCPGCSHSWRTSPNNRTRAGSGCPSCGHGKVEITDERWELLANELSDRNADKASIRMSSGNIELVWWKCSAAGHEWRAAVANRARGAGCPMCSGFTVVSGETDLATRFPLVAEEWDDPERLASETPPGADYYVQWKCKAEGHTWRASPFARTRMNQGCPHCHGIGSNSRRVATVEDLFRWWDAEANTGVDPSMVHATSDEVVSWKCADADHRWRERVFARTERRQECPVCSGRIVQKGVNDVFSTHPALAVEWHPSLNEGVDPSTLSARSNLVAWWKCVHDAEHPAWESAVNTRAGKQWGHPGVLCAVCVSEGRGSAGERELASFVEEVAGARGFEVQRNVRGVIPRLELDLVVPGLGVAFEFNGVYWHSDQVPGRAGDYHVRKREACEAAGLRLVSVWEDDWLERREAVLEHVRGVLGAPGRPLVRASSCALELVELDVADGADMFAENHPAGVPVRAESFMGLYEAETGEVVLCLALGFEHGLATVEGVVSLAYVDGGLGLAVSLLQERHPGVRVRVGLDYGLYAGEHLPAGGMTVAAGVDESFVMNGRGVRGASTCDGQLRYRDGRVEARQEEELVELPRVRDAGWALYL